MIPGVVLGLLRRIAKGTFLQHVGCVVHHGSRTPDRLNRDDVRSTPITLFWNAAGGPQRGQVGTATHR
jgi:hypothetical protein